jgi:hypothetical protein
VSNYCCGGIVRVVNRRSLLLWLSEVGGWQLCQKPIISNKRTVAKHSVFLFVIVVVVVVCEWLRGPWVV